MKTERRHELQTNVLADWLGEKIDALKPYSTAISATLLAVAVGVFAFVYWSQKNQARQAQGWKRYFNALEESGREDADEGLRNVADDYAKLPPGEWSRLSLADAQLAKGVDQLFNDRAASRQTLDDAVESYRAVLDAAPPDSPLAERATLGLAEAYESKNDLDEAREQYRALIERWPDGAFTALAQERLDDLDRKGTKDFYDWFARQSPKPKTPKGPGKPGERPPFDLGNLPDENPFGSTLGFGQRETMTEPPSGDQPKTSLGGETPRVPSSKEPPANETPSDESPNDSSSTEPAADPASSLGGKPDE